MGGIFKAEEKLMTNKLNNIISVPAIVEMMIQQKTATFKYNGIAHHGFTEEALKSLVEQILQICSNNLKTK